MHTIYKTLLYSAIAPLALAIPAMGNDLKVNASFQPDTVQVGQSTAYTLTFEGISVAPSVDPPHVKGLTWAGTSRQTSIQMQGRRVQQTVTVGFNTRASSEGTYTVPAWSAHIEGQRVTFPEATLTVTAARDDVSSSADDRRTIALEDAIFLRLADFPESAYVGEAIKSRIELHILEDLRERDFSNPSQEGSDFIVLGQAERASLREEINDGLRYKVYSWPIALSPLKAGLLELSYQQVVVVGIPRHDSSRSGPFANDPLVDQMRRMMGAQMDNRQLSLSSPPVTIRINELPQAGRPNSFNGAVGQFKVESVSIDNDQIQTGEPAKVTYTINGTGNLVRVQPPNMSSNDWRVLSPRAEFLSHDPLEIRGRKTFSYTLIPETNQPDRTPTFEFSFFDPDQESYQTLAVDGFPVSVTGEPTRRAIQEHGPAKTPRKGDSDRLLPLRTDWGALGSTPSPLFRSPLFLASQLIPLLALAFLYGHTRHKWKLRNDPAFARREHLLRRLAKLQTAARSALSNEDPAAALTVWHNAIRCALALHLKQTEPEAVTSQDLTPLLDCLNTDERKLLISLFHAADATRYGHAQALAPDPTSIHALLRKLSSKQFPSTTTDKP